VKLHKKTRILQQHYNNNIPHFSFQNLQGARLTSSNPAEASDGFGRKKLPYLHNFLSSNSTIFFSNVH